MDRRSFITFMLLIIYPDQLSLSDSFFVWKAPPPAWNQTKQGTDDIQTTQIRILNGSKNYHLTWNYSLQPSESITFAFIAIDDGSSPQPDTIGYVLRGNNPIINNRHDYQTRFRIESTRDYSTLTIQNVNQREQATFQCRLQVGLNTWAYNARIVVTDPSRITYISGNQTVNVGKTVQLHCTASGNPAPNISWARVSDDSFVTFPLNITSKHNGAYRCTAENGIGNPATAVVFVSVQIPPDIIYISGNLTVNQNDQITLNCTAEGNPQPTVAWTRLTGDSVTTFPLTITGKQDAGGYRCTAENGVGDPAIAEVFIAVLIPPDITEISGNQTVNQRDTVTLNCTADGSPPPNITWTRVSDNTVVTFPLAIVAKQDEGMYRCTANNGVGVPATAEVSIEMKNYRPLGTHLTVNVISNNTVLVNKNFNLTCSSQADPPAKYRFYRGQDSLFNTTLGNIVAVYATSVSERINQVNFSCTPFNDFGEGPTETVNVAVRYPPEIVSTQPVHRKYIEGDNVILVCNAIGSPTPSIEWTKQGSNLVLSSSETLHLASLTRDDGAVYRCKAENHLGSSETNITIIVLWKPNVNIKICSTPVLEGGDATLECTAIGNPVPSTAWIRKITGRVVSYNKTLVIRGIQRNQSGSYQCLAWNRVGNNSASCTIDVQYPPSASYLKVVPSNTTVLLGSLMTLICSTDANPKATVYVFSFNGAYLGVSTSGVLNVTVDKDGMFTCTPVSALGTGRTSFDVTVVVPSSVKLSQKASPVLERINITLYCYASGKPEPSITWTRVGSSEVLSKNSKLTVVNISRPRTSDDMIQYQCSASNGVGSPALALVNITVHYLPEIIKPQTALREVKVGESATIECLANGNPKPQYTWHNAAGDLVSADGNLTLNNVNDNNNGNYTCTATDMVDSVNFTVLIQVTRAEIQLEVSVEKLNGLEAEYQKEFDDLNSAPAKAFRDEFVHEIDKVYMNDTLYQKAEVNGLRRGSIIASLKIYFKTAVTTTEGLATLRNVISGGTLGPFTVGTIKIVQGEVHPNTPEVIAPVTKTAFSEAATPGRETSTSPASTNSIESSTPTSLGNDGNEVPVEVLLLLLCLSCYVQVRVI